MKSKIYNHAIVGPIIAYSAGGDLEVKLYDVRDGQNMLSWRLSERVGALQNSRTVAWVSNHVVATSGKKNVFF